MEINQLPSTVKQSLLGVTPLEEVTQHKGVFQSAVLPNDSEIQKEKVVTPEVLTEKLNDANKGLSSLGMHGLAFSIDETTKSFVVKLIDQNTDEVIKQYPSEDALRVFSNIQKYLDSAQEQSLSGKQSLTGSLLSEII